MGLVLFVLIFSANFMLDSSQGHPTKNNHEIKNIGIVGGHIISIEDAPYMVSIREDGSHQCGGSIIHKKFILTAAHCFDTYEDGEYQVAVGTDTRAGGTIYEIEKIIKHKNFFMYENDICLIKLTQPLKFGENVSRVKLPQKEFEYNKDVEFQATGWGDAEDYEPSMYLRQVTVPLISFDVCKETYEDYISNKMICAGENGKDTCGGDSGGPLTLNGVQEGITAFGVTCGASPGVYTSVFAFKDWIDNNIKNNL